MIRKIADYINFSLNKPRFSLNKDIAITRLGTDYGGWSVPVGAVDANSVVYCAGAGEDISFDIALAEKFGCKVHIFDPTPRAITYVKTTKESLPPEIAQKLVMHEYGMFNTDTELKFYSPRNPQHVSHSLTNLQHTNNYFEATVKSLGTIMSELGHSKIDLLKIDIEGAEYDVLDDILSKNYAIKTLCLEFHKPPSRMVKTIKKLEQSGYSVIDASDYWNYTFYKI